MKRNRRPPVTLEERETALRQIIEMLGVVERAAKHLDFMMLGYLIASARIEAQRILATLVAETDE